MLVPKFVGLMVTAAAFQQKGFTTHQLSPRSEFMDYLLPSLATIVLENELKFLQEGWRGDAMEKTESLTSQLQSFYWNTQADSMTSDVMNYISIQDRFSLDLTRAMTTRVMMLALMLRCCGSSNQWERREMKGRCVSTTHLNAVRSIYPSTD